METAPSYLPLPGSDLPLYVTQKTVRAAKILAVHTDPHGDQHKLEFFAGKLLSVTTDWLQRRCGPSNPVGGYFIAYPDGYTSWSPAAAFEETATPAVDYGLPLHQEPKYTIGPRGRIINRATSQPIPDGEPIMILRGKDAWALAAVTMYRENAEAVMLPKSVRVGAAERLHAFASFASAFPESMKAPT
jgi:hypothetical protein